jgi:hypothetical protein
MRSLALVSAVVVLACVAVRLLVAPRVPTPPVATVPELVGGRR